MTLNVITFRRVMFARFKVLSCSPCSGNTLAMVTTARRMNGVMPWGFPDVHEAFVLNYKRAFCFIVHCCYRDRIKLMFML